MRTSANATLWNTATFVANGAADGAAFGNGLFVAAGSRLVTGPALEGVVGYSRDGRAWTIRAMGDTLPRLVGFGDGRFVVWTDQSTLTSDDGMGWTSHPTLLDSAVQAVTFGNGVFVAVGTEGKVFTSTDGGLAWTPRVSATTGDLNAVAFTGTRYIAVGDASTVVVSDYEPPSGELARRTVVREGARIKVTGRVLIAEAGGAIIVEMRIYALNGQIAQRASGPAGRVSLDLSRLARGTYRCETLAGGVRSVQAIVLSR